MSAGTRRHATHAFATRREVGDAPLTTTTVVSGPPPARAGGAVATAADALPIYRFLMARLIAEAAIKRAVAEGGVA